MSARKELFVFDFDQTIVDADSDLAVYKLVGAEHHEKLRAALRDPKMKWERKKAVVCDVLFKEGADEEKQRDALERIPLTEGMAPLLEHIRERVDKYDCVIVSDANTFSVGTLLRAHRLDATFDRVCTNYGAFDARGRMVQRAYHSHACPACPDNMCKREVVRLMLEQARACGTPYRAVRYVGDGSNDLCPAAALTHCDHLYVRRGLDLDKEMTKEDNKIRVSARVVRWCSGVEILRDLERAK